MRPSKRLADQLRDACLTRHYTRHAPGSVLIELGQTRVLCTAVVESQVPEFLKGQQRGWLTAEYSMLPGATHKRHNREAVLGRQTGRTQEIQRFIGRSLRAIVDFEALGERQIRVDCDVLEADGSTRTASVTGAFVAVHDALSALVARQQLARFPLKGCIAAVSVGLYEGAPIVDLDYLEDAACDTDMNLVMTDKGMIVEIQGTAERAPFLPDQLSALFNLGSQGIKQLIKLQQKTLEINNLPASIAP